MEPQKALQNEAARQVEAEAARLFGKHVFKTKGAVLLAVTLAVCALPMLLGLRLWDRIPEVVTTGLTGLDGEDDSLPRWAVVFLLPGLMCLLDLITHVQLGISQRRMTLPKAHIRLMGRWGFPILSLLLCGSVILWSAGAGAAPLFWALCVLGMVLMLLGSRMWDRRAPGVSLLAAGLLAVVAAMLSAG